MITPNAETDAGMIQRNREIVKTAKPIPRDFEKLKAQLAEQIWIAANDAADTCGGDPIVEVTNIIEPMIDALVEISGLMEIQFDRSPIIARAAIARIDGRKP